MPSWRAAMSSPQGLFINPTLCHHRKAKFVPDLNYSFHPHFHGELCAMRLLCHSWNTRGIARVNLFITCCKHDAPQGENWTCWQEN